MSERREFEMTERELTDLMAASRRVPMIWLSGDTEFLPSAQENANAAWAKLGEKYGFDPMTAQPLDSSKSPRFFTAEPIKQEEDHDEERNAERP